MKTFECPNIGYRETDVVTMAHGSGGGAMQRLISEMFAKAFPNLQKNTDAAHVFIDAQDLVITTDSFVIDPIFFPGGDIGSLSVHGTVNDLAMMGAQIQYLTVAFILEEGFPLKDLETVVHSLAEAARKAGAVVVTGDTKVVGKGQGHGIYINTTGIGIVNGCVPSPYSIRDGDKIIVSGDIGRHGMAIMSVRNGLELDTPILSDSAPLNGMVKALQRENIFPHCMRDATRGGVAAALNELVEVRKAIFRIEENKVPVEESVKGLAEILGLDPLSIANEGTFIAFVRKEQAEKALEVLRTFENGKHAAIIGEVTATCDRGVVTSKTMFGGEKIIQMPEGEILPRIC